MKRHTYIESHMFHNTSLVLIEHISNLLWVTKGFEKLGLPCELSCSCIISTQIIGMGISNIEWQLCKQHVWCIALKVHGPIFQNLVLSFIWRIIIPKMSSKKFIWSGHIVLMYKTILYIAVAYILLCKLYYGYHN